MYRDWCMIITLQIEVARILRRRSKFLQPLDVWQKEGNFKRSDIGKNIRKSIL